jgi:hypothetical protein
MEPILDHKLALDSLHSNNPNSIGCHHPPPYTILWNSVGWFSIVFEKYKV